MLTFQDDDVRRDLAERTGTQVDLPLGSFDELEGNLQAQVQRIRAHPWTKDVPVHGLIYEVESGRLREVA
jgi:carbonic anhydrase